MTAPEDTPFPTKLSEVRDLAAIPLFSAERPNFAGLMGASRWSAYTAARQEDIPVRRIGKQYFVLVQPLRRVLGDLPETSESEVAR